MDNLTSYLSTAVGFKTISEALGYQLKAQKFSEIESYLRGHMSVDGSPISQLCLRMPLNCAHFDPQSWKNLARDIVSADQGQGKVSAIGFDLTGHWEGEGPGFEVSLYGDEMTGDFRFSGQNHASLLAHANYPTPWQGGFDHCDGFGPIKGLEALYAALYAYPNRDWRPSADRPSAMPDGFTGYFLGLVFLHLRVQQTFVRDLKQHGLPLAMPVLLGTHDFMGIFFPAYNVLMNTTIAQGIPSYDQIQLEKNVDRLRKAKAYAAEQIDEMTKNWVMLRHVNGHPRAKNQQISDALASSINFTLSMGQIAPAKPIEEMKEAEFKFLMETYYQARLQRVA